jgi:hypothetical protein
VTLTSTVQPSSTSQIIIPSATDIPTLAPALEEPQTRIRDYSGSKLNSIETQTEPNVAQTSKARQRKRKNRRQENVFDSTPPTDHYNNGYELSSPAYAPFDYYKRGDYYQEPRDFKDPFDTRRLKRRGDVDEDVIQDREFLLEPSYDTDSSNKFPALNKCPEITVTKTVTKFVNAPAASPSYSNSNPDPPNPTPNRSFSPTRSRTERFTLHNQVPQPQPQVQPQQRRQRQRQSKPEEEPPRRRNRGRSDIIRDRRVEPEVTEAPRYRDRTTASSNPNDWGRKLQEPEPRPGRSRSRSRTELIV